MGQVKGKPVVSRSVQETLKDLELQRLDLGNKNVYLSHLDLVDVTLYRNITWLNVCSFNDGFRDGVSAVVAWCS
jgi:hypothetical protein